ncbi:MAG: hypothetical protein ABIS59_04075 [Candidatus Saccharibacteria bacterium]
MIDFSCQMYIGAHASFNPVLQRTNIKKVAKFSHISHKDLTETSMRNLLAVFESIPKRL